MRHSCVPGRRIAARTASLTSIMGRAYWLRVMPLRAGVGVVGARRPPVGRGLHGGVIDEDLAAAPVMRVDSPAGAPRSRPLFHVDGLGRRPSAAGSRAPGGEGREKKEDRA